MPHGINVLLIHGFAVVRINIPGPSQKTDVITSNVHTSKRNLIRQNDVSLCPGIGVFKTLAGNVPFCASIGKKNFSKYLLQSIRVSKRFYAIITIKHASLIH